MLFKQFQAKEKYGNLPNSFYKPIISPNPRSTEMSQYIMIAYRFFKSQIKKQQIKCKRILK